VEDRSPDFPLSEQSMTQDREGTELAKFQAFYDVAVAMTADRSLDESLLLVVNKARELLNGDTAYIALRDDEKRDVYIHTVCGIRTEEFNRIRVPFGASIGGRIAQSGQPYIVEDYFKETEPLLHDLVRAEGLVSGVAVPVQVGGRNLGVLYVFNRTPTTFTESDVDTLSLLGNLAAVEITRDYTKSQLRQARDELEHRVEVRTAELQASNEHLRKEIAQRESAEKALRESEEKNRLVVQNAHEGIFIASGGRFRFVNPRIVEIVGHSEDELLSRPFTDFIHPDDGGLVLERHYRRLQGDFVPRRYPFRMVDRQGNVTWVEINTALITWEEAPAVLGFMVDITDRRSMEKELWEHRHHLKEMVAERTAELHHANERLLLEIAERNKAEEALGRNRQMLHNILTASPIGIGYFEDGCVKWTNQAMADMFGEDWETAARKWSPVDFYAGEDEFRRVREIFYQNLGEDKSTQTDAKFRRRDGTLFDGQIHISALDPRNPRKGTIATISDISGRKMAEQAVRESEERYRGLYIESVRAQELYRSLLNSSADAIVVYDTEGRVRYVSDSFTAMFGWTLSELEGGQLEYVPESERQATITKIQGVLDSGMPDSGFETKRLTRDGRVLDTSISASQYHDHEGNAAGMLVILRDITARKQAEQALAQSEKQLRLLSAQLLTAQENERKRVARDLHDGIGQSLTAIKFRLENAMRHMDEEAPGGIEESLRPIIPVIQDAILEVRRISMDLRPSILDDLGILVTITWFCREFSATYSSIAIEKQIELEEQEIPEPLKIVIFRILQEALNNVAKHGNADLVKLSLAKTAGRIELVIEDNGIGFRSDGAPNDKTVPRGFGLASMRERTESLGGSFEVESTCCHGTIIRASWADRSSR